MSKPHTSHLERTATEPRQSGLHRASICYIRNVNPRVRLLRLALPYAVQFLPGQWLDVHIPALPNHTGGFTITSTPADASEDPPRDSMSPSRQIRRPATPRPYFELAIQQSATNPPAAWLWKNEAEIMGEDVMVRVGGNFVWFSKRRLPNKVVFVAGGVGINPLISMLSHLAQSRQKDSRPPEVKLLYSTRLAGGTLEQILFLPRLKEIFQELNSGGMSSSNTIDLHISDELLSLEQENVPPWMSIHKSRVSHHQLLSALGSTAEPQRGVEAYVCGPPAMTDELVRVLESQENMKGNVFCESWW